jgi:NADPH:quinone reductase-like Zn-dependent oxidoreductase
VFDRLTSIESGDVVRAIVCTAYGPPEVLHAQEVPTPTPKSDEVRVKIHVTTAHVGDTRIRGFKVPPLAWPIARIALGLFKPRNSILGMEFAGTVDAVGQDVTRFSVGDEVLGFTGFRFGAYAEYICVPEDGRPSKVGMVAMKPAKVSYEQAAPVAGGGITALLVLRKAKIQSGQRVLIYGASGSVGTFAVQLAKHHFGAEVTGVCSTANLELVRSLGADKVIDYTKEDFTAEGETYDVVFDAVSKCPKARAKECLKPTGTYLDVESSSNSVKLTTEDLVLLANLLEDGTLRSVIDRRYLLDEIVEAHRYVDKGHKKGNVIVTVAG